MRTSPGLRSLLCAAALLGFGLAAGTASAERFPPTPQGEDVAFVQLGSVGEMVTLELYRAAAASTALTGPERKAFRRLAGQEEKAWGRLNGLLGDEALSDDDFVVKIPAAVLRSPQQTLALAARFERLLAGLYLSGVQSIVDPPTRLLIGNHLVTATRNLTLVRKLRSASLNLKAPKPLSVQYVGTQFDRYLAIPGA